mgnify:CR=1 FL=1
MNRRAWGLIRFFVFLLALSIAVTYMVAERQVAIQKEKGQMTKERLLAMGNISFAHENLINDIKMDLSLNQEILVLLGHYGHLFGEAALIKFNDPDNNTYYLVMDILFYSTLTEGEKTILISHELKHATHPPEAWLGKEAVKYQMDADTYAAKRTSPEAVIDLLEKIKGRFQFPITLLIRILIRNSEEYDARMTNLKNLQSLPEQ